MKEEERLSKLAFNVFKLLLKYIPIALVVIYFVNTILAYTNLDNEIISFITYYLILFFILIASIVFRFCKWHKICIITVIACEAFNTLDYCFTLPLADYYLCVINIIILLGGLLIALKYRFK